MKHSLNGRHRAGFTLIELILVMTILLIAVSLTAPALASFFRGRSLDSEARRILSLTREGQSRAVAEGLPIELWFDATQHAFGLEAEPSYEPVDAKAVSVAMDNDMIIGVVYSNPANASGSRQTGMATASEAKAPIISNHKHLPRIRFLTDGSVSEESPQSVRITGKDGRSLWLTLPANRLRYEIRDTAN